ncbi:MAG: TetR/AcrR family transcriptional regulator [Chlorobiales bacterium]|nr:TetR/AcrR family transcriptional regulator [Chlorobiales bacterium]
MSKDKVTEDRIFEAARMAFHRSGFDGARMQEIADEAGINKALLHYYFRSKDKLFEAVLHDAMTRIGPKMFEVLDSDMPLEEKVKAFVERYIDTVMENPYLPGFIIHEMHCNTERFKSFVADKRFIKLGKLKKQLQDGVDEGKYRPISAEQFFLNMFGLCAFPFVAKYAMQAFLGINDRDYQKLLQERKKEVPEFILNTLRK